METVQAQSMPITETNQLCKTLTNGKDEIVDEISKQLEDELLYGGGNDDQAVDDGDGLSDDALSEDSYRLRVSDDENDDEAVDNQTSEGVNKEEKKEADKTELIESSSDIHGMDSVKFQQNHNINCELNSLDSKADVDFTDDYVHGQDNFCNDSDNFDFKKCPQLENNINYGFKLSSEEDYEDPDISIKSDQSSIVDNKVDDDDDNEKTKSAEADESSKKASENAEADESSKEALKSAEPDENSKEASKNAETDKSSKEASKRAEADESSKEAPKNAEADESSKEASKRAETDESSKEASKSEEVPKIKEEVIESECLMDDPSDGNENEICRSETLDNEEVDNSEAMKEKSDDVEVTPTAEEETKSPDNDNTSEQVNSASDIEDKQDKDDQNMAINDMNDKESHTEESSDSGIASGGQSVVTSDDLSKEPSLNDDSSNSDVKDKVLDGECESLDLECGEMEMNVESEVLKKKDDTETVSVEEVDETVLEVTMETIEDGSSKRRLSLVENETSSPAKIPCMEEVPKQTDEIKETADVSVKVTSETVVPQEKPAGAIFSIKAVPTESLRKIISSNEIIDIEDDNTIDSSSIEVPDTANGSALSPDSTKLESESNETKLNDSPNKEIISELGIVDDTKKIIRRRTRRGITLVAEKDLVTRTRREAAQKAEVTVRKNIVTLNNDSDESETSDSTNLIPYNPKPRVTSPTSLKRNHIDGDDRVDSSTPKKFKTEIEKENSPYKTEATKLETRKTLEHVRQFFLRDGKQKLKKLTQEELEELFIQKIIETITMRDEIGKLREQAKISERNQEATRLKCQQLTKQIKDFEMVLSRYAADRRNNTEAATPIKINRSVGLQVNFLNDHGVQNLRQIQAGRGAAQPRIMPKGPVNGLTPSPGDDSQNGRRGLKVRSPRRSEAPAVAPIGAPVQTTIPAQPLVSTVTPSVIPVAKTIDTRNTAVTTVQQQVHQIHTNQIVLNGGTVTTQQRTPKVLTPNNKNNAEFIDLTEEVKKKNTPVSSMPPLTAIITSATNSTTVPKVQTRFQRVVPTSASVTIPQSAIRVVQPAGQPTPTALVNNMSSIGGAPRFLMVQPNGATRQLVIAPNSSQIRTSTVNTRPAFSNIAYASVPSMANGAVRVVPTSGTTTVQLYKVTHPAPLPEVMSYPPNPALKLPPPAPSLKISKVAHGIVLSWNMALTDKFAEIASYQLYAYQEITGMAPSSLNWKKVGDVRALPLPMACTLTQFSEGNNYHFAVRAVDTHSRYGQYSQPGNISL